MLSLTHNYPPLEIMDIFAFLEPQMQYTNIPSVANSCHVMLCSELLLEQTPATLENRMELTPHHNHKDPALNSNVDSHNIDLVTFQKDDVIIRNPQISNLSKLLSEDLNDKINSDNTALSRMAYRRRKVKHDTKMQRESNSLTVLDLRTQQSDLLYINQPSKSLPLSTSPLIW